MTQNPPPAPYTPRSAEGLVCPKCRGQMRTYDRNGVHIDQCDGCRGIFLDFGELEHLTELEGRFASAPPPAPGSYGGHQGGGYRGDYGPDWGQRGGRHYRKRGLSGLFFSS